jgi:uncharacterized protein YjdB
MGRNFLPKGISNVSIAITHPVSGIAGKSGLAARLLLLFAVFLKMPGASSALKKFFYLFFVLLSGVGINMLFNSMAIAQTTISGTASACQGSATALSGSPSGGTWSSSNTSVATVGTAGTVTGVAVGTAIISYTSGTLATVTVTINATPSIISTTGGTLGNITTFAGNGSGGYGGDGGAATSAYLYYPQGVAADASGNIYIADNSNYRVRKVSPSGVITTIAGNGSYGFSGDGGAATAAALNGVVDVAADAAGNVYIADQGNQRIRKVNTSGIISTVAGNGGYGFSGDGGQATAAHLYSPSGIAVDASGNLYITDYNNLRIRKVNTSGIISTFAGNGSYGFGGDGGAATAANLYYPQKVAVDLSGNVYIADGNNQRIRKVNTSGIISTFAGNGSYGFSGDGGAATSATFNYPSSVAVDASGNVYIGDQSNSRIRKVNTSGIVTTIAGTGSFGYGGDGGAATAATLYSPTGVAVDASGNVYVCDNSNQRIRKIIVSGGNATVCTGATTTLNNATSGGVWSSSDLTVATVGTTGVVSGVAAGTAIISYSLSSGCMATTVLTVNQTPSAITGTATVCSGSTTALTDAGGGTWSSSNTGVATIGSTGVVTGVLGGTSTITYNVSGCKVTTTVTINQSPSVITTTGSALGNISTVAGNGSSGFGGDGSAATSANISNPYGVAADASGNIYIADYSNYRVRKVSASGVITTFAGTGSYGYSGDGSAATAANLSYVMDVATDAAGNVYIADQSNHRIRMVNTSGIITTVAGNGSGGFGGDGGAATSAYLNNPSGISVDAGGNLIITDRSNLRIRKVNTSGIISTVAGNGSGGYSGDGGAATSASIYYPTRAVADASGNIYIADGNNYRIRKVNTSGVISTFAGTGTSSFAGDGGAATSAYLNYPSSVAVDAIGNLYIGDQYNNRIRKVNTSGIISTVAGNGSYGFSGDGAAATAANLYSPVGVAVDVAGNVYIADVNNQRIRKITLGGADVMVCTGTTLTLNNGTSGGVWTSVNTAVATIGSGTGVLTPVSVGTSVISYTTSGGCAATAVATVNAMPSAITGTAIVCTGSTTSLTDAGGGSWSSSNASIASVGSTGIVTGNIGGTSTITYNLLGCKATTAVTVNTSPTTITTASGALGNITTVAGNGSASYGGDGGAATSANIYYPQGVAADASGNIYIADHSNNRVRKVSSSGIITTFAGTGSYSYSGDGGAATAATFNGIIDVATDATGNVYIADQSNHRIRKVNTSGIITTVAGNGGGGYGGDGGAATSAYLNNPSGISVDAGGNLYITDRYNQRIRKVNTSGVISTVVGNGGYGYGGDGGAATSAYLYYPTRAVTDASGNIYIADASNQRIRKVNTSGTISTFAGNGGYGFSGDGGAATSAYLNYPASVAVDASGNVYIGDQSNNRIRKVNTSGTISTVAGSGSGTFGGDGGPATAAYLNNPMGVAVDISGNVYIADYYNQRIRKIIGGGTAASVCAGQTLTLNNGASGGAWSSSDLTIATIGSATGVVSGIAAGTATISYTMPAGCQATTVLTVNPIPSAISGTTTVCSGATTALTDAGGGTWSSSNTAVATIGTSGIVSGIIGGTSSITYALAGCNAIAPLTVNSTPSAITVGGGTLGNISTLAGNGSAGYGGDGGAATSAYLYYPQGVATDAGGYIYIADNSNRRVRKVSPSGVITTFAGTGSYGFSGDGGAATAATFTTITDVAVDAAGNVYIADQSNQRIRKVNTSGIVSTVAGNGGYGFGGDGGQATSAYLSYPSGVAVDASGNLYIADQSNLRVRKVNTSGIISTIAGNGSCCYGGDGGAATSAYLYYPQKVAVDGSGNVYIADGNNQRIRKVNTSGIISTFAGNGSSGFGGDGGAATSAYLSYPSSVTVDAGGNVYIGDQNNHRVRKVNTSGTISTIAGTGSGGFSGDGVAATAASLYSPAGVAVDASGNIYIADYNNQRIRKINVSGIAGQVCEGATITLNNTISGGTWSSSNTSTATVVSGTGVVSGVAAGTTTITYDLSNGCSIATFVVTVNPSPAAITGTAVVCAASATTLSTASTGGAWSSGNTGVATVGTGAGLVSGVSAGTSVISYSYPSGCRVTVVATVNPLPAAITGSVTPCAGNSTTLSDISTGGAWSSANTAIATMGTAGVLTGVSGGTVTISYTLTTGCYTTATASINTVPAMAPITGSTVVCVGTTTSLSDATPGGFWFSSDVSIATINSSGIATGVSGGTAVIAYAASNICGVNATFAGITVNTASPITGTTTVCTGTTSTLSNSVSGGTWSSSNTSVATIGSGSGVVSGITSGTTIITYMLSCGAVTTTVTVTSGASAGTISGPATVCPGSTITLTDAVSGGSWSSSNTAVASVSAGVVTGVSAGTTTISYTVTSGCGTASATYNVTVNAAPAAGTISGATSVCEAATITLSETVSGGSWSSSSTANATVSSGGVVSGVSAGTTTISYAITDGCSTSYATLNITIDPLPNAGAISGSSSVCPGGTITLSETVSGGSWASSSTANATISSAGVVSGVSAGSTTISYTVTNGCGSATATMNISVDLSPDAGSISGSSAVCETATITLSETVSGGSWSSSSTANATVSSAGVVTGVAAGTTTISYTVTSVCGTATATYNVTINAAPSAGTISGSSAVCEAATITLSDAVSGGSWSSSSTANATISSGGVVSGVSAGTATISYTVTNGCGTAYATTVITINPLPNAGTISGSTNVCEAATITLSSTVTGGSWSSGAANATVSSAGVVTGVSAGTATISYSVSGACGTSSATWTVTIDPLPNAGTISGPTNVISGGSVTLTDAVSGGTWSMANGNATITSAGIVTGVTVGMDTVYYSVTNGCGTATASQTITISASIPPISGDTSVCVGATSTLTDASSGGTWTSSNTSVAIIGSASGIVTGMAAGTAIISYFDLGVYVTQVIVVNPLPASITGTMSLCGSTTTSLSDATGGGAWSSSNTSVATVGTSGTVSGVSGGTSIISYTTPAGCYVTATVSVTPVSPINGSAGVCIGSSITLTDSVSGGTWTSGTPSSATVGSATGIVTGVAAPSTTIITYSLPSGCRATKLINVYGLPATVTGTATVCQGATTTLSDATGGGEWTSGNTAVATVGSSSGVVTGVGGGTAGITYTLGSGCIATRVVTVSPLPSAILGGTTLCAGTSATLTNLVSGGTWSTSNAGVATIGSATGIVTAVSNGSATITYTVPCGTATVTVTVGGAPVITSVNLNTDTVGATVVISGSNFSATTSNNIVYFGATQGVVTAATSTSLTVTVPSGSIYSPVTVENNGCALTAYEQYPFLPTYNNSAYITTTINFNSKVDFTAGTSPFSVAIGDIDGDGKPDMVSANSGANSISVFRNTSATGSITSGSFAAKVDFTTGASPYSVAIGDLDNDGKLDIVVPNNTSSPATVSVFRNTATSGVINTSSLAAKVDFVVGVGPKAVAIGDLDRDGRADIAVANNGASTISILRNTSASGAINSGSFAAKVDFTSGSHPYGIAIGDLDGDGKPDIAVPNQAVATVSVFRNTSSIGSITSASFATKVDFTTGSQPYSVTIGDVDGDGKMDLIIPNNGAATVSVLRNTATSGSIIPGSFAAKVDFTTGAGPYAVAIGDINGDGKIDLVVANRTANTVSVLRNTATSGAMSSGSFAAKVDLATGSAPVFVAVGDVDGDGKPDIATANISANTVSIIRNNPILHPDPFSGTADGTITLCVGATVTLNSPAQGGEWSSSNSSIAVVDDATGIVKGISAGRASITYSSAAVTSIVNIVVNPLPDAVIIAATPGTNVVPGQKVKLTAAVQNGGTLSQYQWRINGVAVAGATSASFTSDKFANNDVVTCVVSSRNCSDYAISASVTIGVFSAIGNQGLQAAGDVRVVPNPNKGTFTLSGQIGNTMTDEEVSVEITDMLGQVVYSNTLSAPGGRLNAQVQLRSVANGMYLLSLRSGGESKLFHIVIEQ